MFQNQNGVDILLAVVYVDEYGSACAQPNARRVVIRYLDTVQHFEPSA